MAHVEALLVLKSTVMGLDPQGCFWLQAAFGVQAGAIGLVTLFGVALCQPLSPACCYRHRSWCQLSQVGREVPPMPSSGWES